MARSVSIRILLVAALAALAILSAAPGPCAAQAAPSAPTDAQRARARQLYAEGQRHFQADRFAEALASFEAAYREVPNPVVLLGVASAQERLERREDAARTLRRYLRERTDAPDRASIEQRIAALDPSGATAEPEAPTGGTIRVTSSPSGAAISLDGTETGRTSPADLSVAPGEHHLALTLEGHAPVERMVAVAAGEIADATFTLAVDEPSVSSEGDVFAGEAETSETTETSTETSVEAPVVDPGPSAGVWVTAAIAGATLVGGTVLGFLALSAQSDFDSNPSHETADRGQTFALIADLSFGVAIAAGVTAIVLYATERPTAEVTTTTTTTTTTTSTETSEGEPAPDAAEGNEDEDIESAPAEGATTSAREGAVRATIAPWAAPSGGGAAMLLTF